MDDLFADSKLRIRSAKKRIPKLKSALDGYMGSGPFELAIDPHTDGIQQALKLRLRKQIPREDVLACAHIIEDLRSALDLCVASVAHANGVQHPVHISFPFVSSEGDFDRNAKGRCKGVPAEILDHFRSFKPFKGGDDELFALNILAGQTKHVRLSPIAHAIGGSYVQRVQWDFTDYINPVVPNWNVKKNEVVVLTYGPKTTGLKCETSFAITVIFSGIEALKNYSVVDALLALARKVEWIVSSTSDEIARIERRPKQEKKRPGSAGP